MLTILSASFQSAVPAGRQHIWTACNTAYKMPVLFNFYCKRILNNTRKQTNLCYLFLCCLLVAKYCFTVVFHQRTSDGPLVAVANNKVILVWDTRDHIDLQALDQKSLDKCPFPNCFLTREKSTFHQADAVVFNMPPILYEDIPKELHDQRRPNQRYVFLSPEPPVLFGEHHLERFNGFFNWTMTYRRDADIVYSYGSVEPLSNIDKVHKTARKPSKTKMVAWFVSHCFTQSRREAYVEELRKYIAVDVYGDCKFNGSLRCGHNTTTHLSDDSCYQMLDQDYRFYLAFENSLCTDYVTEKFFKILQRRVVPVVLGAGDYQAVAPPGSFVDATKLSPRQLASKLRRIASNEKLYESFFDWKSRFKVRPRYPDIADKALCDLCTKLHTDHKPSIAKDLVSLWGPGECRKAHYKGLPFVFGVF